jgi:hypothetical protein
MKEGAAWDQPLSALIPFGKSRGIMESLPEAGVLDEPDLAKPAQRISHAGPPGYIGWTLFQPL